MSNLVYILFKLGINGRERWPILFFQKTFLPIRYQDYFHLHKNRGVKTSPVLVVVQYDLNTTVVPWLVFFSG
jgi:hypothetical protein